MVRDTVVYKKVQDQIPWTKEQVMAEFKTLDKDGDGRISKEELKAAFNKFGSRWSSFRASRALCQADAEAEANMYGCFSTEELDELVKYGSKWGFTVKK